MTTEIPFKDQSASGLRLNLVTGKPDLSGLTVIDTRCFSGDGVKFTVGVLGASHFATMEFGDQIVSEVFACAELKTDLPRILFGPLGNVLKKIVLTLCGHIKYSFEAQIVDCRQGRERLKLLEERISRALPETGSVGLVFEFSGGSRVAGCPAETAVLARVIDRGAVTIETAHCYPNEEKIIFTRSEAKEVEQ